MKIKYLFCIIGLFLIITSCLEDIGNYDYNYGNEVTIRFKTYNHSIKVGDKLTVKPIRTFKFPESDTLNYEHIWYKDTEIYSDKDVLEFIGDSLGSYSMTYYMKDITTGIMFPAASSFTINVKPIYNAGWIILYEKDNSSELAAMVPNEDSFDNYVDLYKMNNNGEVLGSQPVFIKDYYVSSRVRGLLVVQRGGQGSIELNSNNFKKELLLSDQFIGQVPDNFNPIDAAFLDRTHFVVNNNGDIYRRYLMNYNDIPWNVPWNNSPEQIEGGMKIIDIWDSWSGTYLTLMYDDLNKRILQFKPSGSSLRGQSPINPIAKPTVPYPDLYFKFDDLGNIKYLWGGTFNDDYNYLKGVMLFKSLDDNKVYYQDFKYSTDYYNPSLKPVKCIEFPKMNLITPGSKFVAIKNRDYLFFSGSENNQSLFYFDIITTNEPVLYKQLEAPITSLYSSDDGNTIAVGLENGSVYLFGISHDVIISGQSKELHSLHGLGKVVDIVTKSGRIS